MKGHYLRELTDDAVEAFLAAHAGSGCRDAFLPSASLQSYGGAIADVADHETAFAHRDVFVELVAAARWTDPAEDAARIEGARRYAAALEPHASAYVNVLADEGRSTSAAPTAGTRSPG